MKGVFIGILFGLSFSIVALPNMFSAMEAEVEVKISHIDGPQSYNALAEHLNFTTNGWEKGCFVKFLEITITHSSIIMFFFEYDANIVFVDRAFLYDYQGIIFEDSRNMKTVVLDPGKYYYALFLYSDFTTSFTVGIVWSLI